MSPTTIILTKGVVHNAFIASHTHQQLRSAGAKPASIVSECVMARRCALAAGCATLTNVRGKFGAFAMRPRLSFEAQAAEDIRPIATEATWAARV